jgi:hypothetical protein
VFQECSNPFITEAVLDITQLLLSVLLSQKCCQLPG